MDVTSSDLCGVADVIHRMAEDVFLSCPLPACTMSHLAWHGGERTRLALTPRNANREPKTGARLALPERCIAHRMCR
eukprot:15458548-Alexandrium_andersonii.AAC.1